MSQFYDFVIKDIKGQSLIFRDFQNKSVLIVNTASACGLTPQYAGLEALHQGFAAKGLIVLGVPCNQFANQEPGSPQEIMAFCSREYGITFPLLEKMDVNGPHAHPLYQWLTGPSSPEPGPISWNFEKFLVDRTGRIVNRFHPRMAPDDPLLVEAINRTLL